MAVAFRQPVQVGANNWRVSWTSGLTRPTYRVYRDGRLLCKTLANSVVVDLTDADGAAIEVIDDATTPARTAAEGVVLLAWPAGTACEKYTVEEYVGAAWVRRATKADDGGQRQFWRSAPLSAGNSHQFRVTPIGTNGNAGTPTTITVGTPRHPAPPDVAYTYDNGTSKVTISAA